MPRQNRADKAGSIYHALNRGYARGKIFHGEGDEETFLRVLEEGLERYPVELFSFALMPDHWHLVLRPIEDGQMGRLLRWITATHTLRHRARHRTSDEGRLYQARFKSFPVAEDEQPEQSNKLFSPWPIPRPPDWIERVNQPLSKKQLAALRLCVKRGRPFGNDEWVAKEAERTGLGYTLRSRGRPPQPPQ